MSGPFLRVVARAGQLMSWPLAATLTLAAALALTAPPALAAPGQASPGQASPGQASTVTQAPRIAFDERLSSPPILASAVQTMGKPPAIPVLARLTVDRREIEPPPATTPGVTGNPAPAFRFDEFDRRLALYEASKIPVWLALDLGRSPTREMTREAWARLIRALAARAGRRVRVLELIVPPASPRDVEAIVLDLKRAATELRAVNPDIVVALGAAHQYEPWFVERLYTSDLRPYLDAIVLSGDDKSLALPKPTVIKNNDGTISGVVPGIQHIPAEWTRALLDRIDQTAVVYERGRTLSGTPDAAARSFVTKELWRLGSATTVASYDASSADVVRAALTQAASVQELLTGELTRLDDRAANLTLTRANGEAVRASLLYDLSTFGTFLVYAADGASQNETVRVSLTVATDAKPRIRDPFGPGRAVADFARERDTQRTAFVAPLAGRPLIVDFNDALSDVLTERNEVKGRAMLSVDEIVARHQQAQAAQDAILDHYTASARMEQHFRPAVADPGYDVVTENRFYVDRDGIEWEELSFSVNGSKWKEDRPPFPLLQPEKVLSVPLTLRLTADYTYRLGGVSPVDGRDCYLVHFEPVSNSTRSLYRGTIWIDTTTFVQRKLQTVQTKLSAPVVSNEETHTFTAVGQLEGKDIVLPTRMVAKQIVLIAGRNLLVEKTTTFAEHKVNGDDFRERRQTARASNRIMYRDTDRGVRYYVKEGGQRVVSDRSTTSAKAMAMGVTLDPSFDFPLPIFGINYLDFDFGGPDSQLALLFGGVLALGNVQRPKLFGTSLDGSIDFFGIAVPGSDRLYDASGEHEAERILTWPISTGVNVGYQFTSFQKLAGQYQFRFDGYVRDRTTAEDYTLPKSTTTHGIGLAYEYRRAGYSVTANGTWYGRARWAPWGPAGALESTARTYEKFSVNVSKDWFVGLFHKIHANGAYFGGTRLDRFSQYQFGLFDDTRIHGVPASGVRMSELAMARGAYSFNIFEQYRVDLFLEQAFGRDKDKRTTTDWERITGLGVAFNVKGPWNTILRVDAGKSFLPPRYQTQGSTVVQILMLKPLKGR